MGTASPKMSLCFLGRPRFLFGEETSVSGVSVDSVEGGVSRMLRSKIGASASCGTSAKRNKTSFTYLQHSQQVGSLQSAKLSANPRRRSILKMKPLTVLFSGVGTIGVHWWTPIHVRVGVSVARDVVAIIRQQTRVVRFCTSRICQKAKLHVMFSRLSLDSAIN